MDRAEEISKQLMLNRRSGRIDSLSVLSGVRSCNRFLPACNASFYMYIRQRILMFMGEADYVINARQTMKMETYCGMVAYTQNAYFILYVHADFSCEMIKLDLSELANYTIYSGQIIKLSGTNPIGEQIVVDSIVYDVLLDSMVKPEKETVFTLTVINGNRIKNSEVYTDKELETTNVPGPAEEANKKRSSESKKILEMIKQCSSDAVIVIGDVSVEERKEFKKLCSIQNIRLICVPTHDGINSTMSYPGEFINKISDASIPSSMNNEQAQEMYKVSNSPFLELQTPCMLNINGILIAVTSIDMLFGISRKEIGRNRKNRMLDITNHSVYQNTFLPFIPHDIPVDYSVYSAFIWQYKPDVLIFPTFLSASTEEVCSTHAVPMTKDRIDMRIEFTKDGSLSVSAIPTA